MLAPEVPLASPPPRSPPPDLAASNPSSPAPASPASSSSPAPALAPFVAGNSSGCALTYCRIFFASSEFQCFWPETDCELIVPAGRQRLPHERKEKERQTFQHASTRPIDLERNMHLCPPTLSPRKNRLTPRRKTTQSNQPSITQNTRQPRKTHLFPLGTPGVCVFPSTQNQSSWPSGWTIVSELTHVVEPRLPTGRAYWNSRLRLDQGCIWMSATGSSEAG